LFEKEAIGGGFFGSEVVTSCWESKELESVMVDDRAVVVMEVVLLMVGWAEMDESVWVGINGW